MIRVVKEQDEEHKVQLVEDLKISTGELLVKIQRMLEKNGGEFLVGQRVSILFP